METWARERIIRRARRAERNKVNTIRRHFLLIAFRWLARRNNNEDPMIEAKSTGCSDQEINTKDRSLVHDMLSESEKKNSINFALNAKRQ